MPPGDSISRENDQWFPEEKSWQAIGTGFDEDTQTAQSEGRPPGGGR